MPRREVGENPTRTRRCKGRLAFDYVPLSKTGREGNRKCPKPEDRPRSQADAVASAYRFRPRELGRVGSGLRSAVASSLPLLALRVCREQSRVAGQTWPRE